jgi:hypothetical protein
VPPDPVETPPPPPDPSPLPLDPVGPDVDIVVLDVEVVPFVALEDAPLVRESFPPPSLEQPKTQHATTSIAVRPTWFAAMWASLVLTRARANPQRQLGT